MSSVTGSQVLALYRLLLRQSSLFSSFNYRMYALRRVRDAFKESKALKDAQAIDEQYQHGLESLAMLKRQTSLNQMYAAPKLVVERV